MAKYLDSTGLTYLWAKIKAWVGTYVSLSNGTITIGSNSIAPLTSHQDISGKADKATTLSGYGITDAKIASGTITLGSNSITPLTSHQDISGKADKSEMSVSTSGDKTTITLKTGTSAVVLNSHQDISGKADAATTLAGYGITDAKIANGVITLGSASITPLTSFTEADPTVPSWAKASSKPSYTASEVGAVATTAVGAASGVCPLNSSSKIDATYLPSYVDDVIEAYARTGQTALTSSWLATGSASGTAITPETGKIYVLMADSGDYAANTQFRWGGSAYVKLADGGVSAITTTEIDSIVAN